MHAATLCSRLELCPPSYCVGERRRDARRVLLCGVSGVFFSFCRLLFARGGGGFPRVFGMLGASWLFAFYGAFIGDLRHRVKGQERILGTRRRTRRDGFGLSGCAAALPRAQQPHHYHVKHEARGGVLCTPARERRNFRSGRGRGLGRQGFVCLKNQNSFGHQPPCCSTASWLRAARSASRVTDTRLLR